MCRVGSTTLENSMRQAETVTQMGHQLTVLPRLLSDAALIYISIDGQDATGATHF
jgi:hypothetical protein